MSKRTRKRYTTEFKREAVTLVTEHGYSKEGYAPVNYE